ncbi:MAG TPA: ImmA/IrrE family metallo-endopeptidase [Armatimonadota bacterium]|jgi:Zn-dependent peptidase ImmA (M78 family)
MTRSQYYDRLRALAREVRLEHSLTSPRVTLSDMRRIYKAYGIRIVYWRHRMRKLRGAYFRDETGAHVMVDATLPDEQRIFTLAHELKHHLAGDDPAERSDDAAVSDPAEIGAEVFAAELIFPDQDFAAALGQAGVVLGVCPAEAIVRLKHDSRTTLSYAALAKKAVFLGFAPRGAFEKVFWKKLEENVYGEPLYKRINRRRQQRGSG